MEQWIQDHTEDVILSNKERAGLDGEELLRWDERPVRSENLRRLRMAKFSRDLAQRLKEAGVERRQEKMDKLRANVASGYKFALTHKGLSPDQITPGTILDILGLTGKCTPAEVGEALGALRASGDLARIEQEDAGVGRARREGSAGESGN